jgi:hypothetical protein
MYNSIIKFIDDLEKDCDNFAEKNPIDKKYIEGLKFSSKMIKDYVKFCQGVTEKGKEFKEELEKIRKEIENGH